MHLRYGQLSLSDVKRACDALPSSGKRFAWGSLSLRELKAARRSIDKEIVERENALKGK